jgi:hypothetical protein
VEPRRWRDGLSAGLGSPGLGFPGLGFPGLGFPGLGWPDLLSAILTGVPEPQDDDCIVLDFIAEFVVAYEEATDLTRGEAFQPWTEARMVAQQSSRSARKDCTARAAAARFTGARNS